MTTILCGGKPTSDDLIEFDKFKAFLLVVREAEAVGVPHHKAVRHACMEIYGNEFGEPTEGGESK